MIPREKMTSVRIFDINDWAWNWNTHYLGREWVTFGIGSLLS